MQCVPPADPLFLCVCFLMVSSTDDVQWRPLCLLCRPSWSPTHAVTFWCLGHSAMMSPRLSWPPCCSPLCVLVVVWGVWFSECPPGQCANNKPSSLCMLFAWVFVHMRVDIYIYMFVCSWVVVACCVSKSGQCTVGCAMMRVDDESNWLTSMVHE